MRLRLWTVVAVAWVAGSGCAFLDQFLRSAVEPPTLTFKTAHLREVGLTGATVDLVFSVHNPNSMGLSLESVEYAFFIEGKQLVAGRPPDGLKIPAAGSTDVTFPASVRFADLAPALEVFLSRDTAAYRAEGALGISTPIGVVRLPLKQEGTFPVPKMPAVALQPPRLTRMDLLGATVELPLQLTNKNPFPLALGQLLGSVQIAGVRVGSVQLNLGALSAQGVSQLTIPLTVHFSQALAAASALRSRTANVSFEGKLVTDGASLPVKLAEQLPILK